MFSYGESEGSVPCLSKGLNEPWLGSGRRHVSVRKVGRDRVPAKGGSVGSGPEPGHAPASREAPCFRTERQRGSWKPGQRPEPGLEGERKTHGVSRGKEKERNERISKLSRPDFEK